MKTAAEKTFTACCKDEAGTLRYWCIEDRFGEHAVMSAAELEADTRGFHKVASPERLARGTAVRGNHDPKWGKAAGYTWMIEAQ
jgi:hypothetical protein